MGTPGRDLLHDGLRVFFTGVLLPALDATRHTIGDFASDVCARLTHSEWVASAGRPRETRAMLASICGIPGSTPTAFWWLVSCPR